MKTGIVVFNASYSKESVIYFNFFGLSQNLDPNINRTYFYMTIGSCREVEMKVFP